MVHLDFVWTLKLTSPFLTLLQLASPVDQILVFFIFIFFICSAGIGVFYVSCPPPPSPFPGLYLSLPSARSLSLPAHLLDIPALFPCSLQHNFLTHFPFPPWPYDQSLQDSIALGEGERDEGIEEKS